MEGDVTVVKTFHLRLEEEEMRRLVQMLRGWERELLEKLPTDMVSGDQELIAHLNDLFTRRV